MTRLKFSTPQLLQSRYEPNGCVSRPFSSPPLMLVIPDRSRYTMVRSFMMLLSFLLVVDVNLCSAQGYALCCIFQSIDGSPSTTHETRLGPDPPPSSTLPSSAQSVVDGATRDRGLSSSSTLAVGESSSLSDVIHTLRDRLLVTLLCLARRLCRLHPGRSFN